MDRSEPTPIRVFESGAILMHLAEKFGAFLPTEPTARAETLSWLFWQRSEEHTSELQSLMRISYAVFCLKKKKKTHQDTKTKKIQKHNKHKKVTRDMCQKYTQILN